MLGLLKEETQVLCSGAAGGHRLPTFLFSAAQDVVRKLFFRKDSTSGKGCSEPRVVYGQHSLHSKERHGGHYCCGCLQTALDFRMRVRDYSIFLIASSAASRTSFLRSPFWTSRRPGKAGLAADPRRPNSSTTARRTSSTSSFSRL